MIDMLKCKCKIIQWRFKYLVFADR